jgi:hypothetical protein
MGRFNITGGDSERRFIIRGNAIRLIVNQPHVERIMAERAILKERARRNQFIKSISV